MKAIEVNASRTYQIHIASGLISQIGAYANEIKSNCKIAVISDSNVWPLYGDTVCSSLRNAGFAHIAYVMPAGEESKNSDQYIKILSALMGCSSGRASTHVGKNRSSSRMGNS